MPKLFFTSLSILLCCAVIAQDNPRFTNYGVNEGLVQSSIDDIIQDKNGFLWVGTAGGLCRFDGYQFKVYKTSQQNRNAIASAKGFHFYNDQSGKLWIAHYNGISVYNALTDNFTNLLEYIPKNMITIFNHFFGEDDQFIWVGLCAYGIVKIDKKTQQVFTTPLTKTSLRPSINVAYHGFIEKNKLWIVDNNESNKPVFLKYDVQTEKTDTLPVAITNIININDSLALGINATSALLINKKTLVYTLIQVNENGTEHNVIDMRSISANEVILSSATKGIYYLDIHAKKVTRHIAVTDPENNTSSLNTNCSYRDKSGNLWVGTTSDGIQKLGYPFKKFRWYRSEIANGNNVTYIYADKEQLYVGTQVHGLTVYSRANGFIKNITLNSTMSSMVNTPFTIKPWGNDKLVIINHSSKSTNSNVPFTYTMSTDKIQLLNKEVQKAFTDNWGRGNLRQFFFMDDDGSYLTNIGESLVSLTTCGDNKLCPKIITHFPGETLASCFRDRDKNIWIGTYNAIYCETKTGWEKIALPKTTEIKTINQDPSGNIWIGTNDEIYVLNKQHEVTKHFTEENGLINAHLYGILRDDDGNMWFSHNKGLSVYRWKEKIFEHFGKEDGLQSPEFNAAAYFKAADGELFFGGIKGVTSFYPREILHNPYAPAVKITGIKLFDVPYKTDTAYWNIRKLELSHTENSISFEFALPEYTNSAKNRYSYIMKGVDDKWIDGGDRRFTRYAGLRPGNYTFQVKGFNNDGVLGNEITSIEIIIIPPYWQRTWFIVLCSLVFILLSIGIGILIQKQRQKKTIQALEVQHKIQMERERISRDLHDNVGTQLSMISKNIQGVIDPLKDISDAERVLNLSSISQTSKDVIFTLRETIWSLNKEEISLEELSDKLKAFTQKLLEFNNSCRLLYSEEIEDVGVVLSPSESIHLFRICQEAITNSLKYANASTINITIRSKDNRYSISIADNGIGFEQSNTKASEKYGLENMKYRANEINCDFMFDTIPGHGTRITISKK